MEPMYSEGTTNCSSENEGGSSEDEGGYSKDYGGSGYYVAISPGANVGRIRIGQTINNVIVPSDRQQALENLAVNLKAFLQNEHKSVEDRLNSLPFLDDWWREDYLQTQYVPLLIYEVKKDKIKKNYPLELPAIFMGGRRIFIEGEAGYGKSTLSRKLAFDWACEEEYLSSRFDFVFYVELRCVGSDSIYEHIINELEKEEQGDRNLLRDLFNQHQKRILFILDGLDELPPQDRVSKLSKLQQCFAASTMLITTQPMNVELRLKYKNFYDCKFAVEGFSTENVDMFITKIISSAIQMQSDDDCEVGEDSQSAKLIMELKDFVKGSYYLNENLETLQHSPLFLCFVCFLFVNKIECDQELPETVSDLYITIMKQLTDNYVNKTLGRESDLYQKETLKEEIELGLNSFGQLALKSIVDDSLTFTEDQIDTCCFSNHIKKIGFLRKNNSFNRRKVKVPVVYQPVHRTFLDYMVAFYISSLKDDVTLDQAIETFIHVPPLLYSKSAKTDGQRPSMLVTLVCGLLCGDAYKFLRKLLKDEHRYFEHFFDICCLLQHCTLNKNNIECAMELRLNSKWDLRWLCGRGFLKTEKFLRLIHISCDILCTILEHPKCPIIKYELSHIDLLHLDKVERDFTNVLNSLQRNRSVKSISFLKHHESANDFAQDICLPVYMKVLKTVVKMENLEKIKVDTDIFIENHSLCVTVLKEFFEEIKYAKSLQALILTATHVSNEILCEDFHDKKSRNRQAKKKHATEKIVDFKLLCVLIESLQHNPVFSKLSLPKMAISCPAADKLFELVTTQTIRVLKIPDLQTEGTDELLKNVVSPVFRSLSVSSCVLEELDMRHLKFEKFHALCLAKHLKTNMTLKILNMVGCFKSFDVVRPVLEALIPNLTMEKINISSSNFVVENDADTELVIQALFPELSNKTKNLKFVGLSGWEFVVKRLSMLTSVAEALSNSMVTELCLHNTHFKIPVPLSFNSEKLAKITTNFLHQCSGLRFLDLRNIEICFVPYANPVCRTDSGFQSFSSWNEELHENSLEDFSHVSFSDDSEVLDLNAEDDNVGCSYLMSETVQSALLNEVTGKELYSLLQQKVVGRVQLCFLNEDFVDYKHSKKLQHNQIPAQL